MAEPLPLAESKPEKKERSVVVDSIDGKLTVSPGKLVLERPDKDTVEVEVGDGDVLYQRGSQGLPGDLWVRHVDRTFVVSVPEDKAGEVLRALRK